MYGDLRPVLVSLGRSLFSGVHDFARLLIQYLMKDLNVIFFSFFYPPPQIFPPPKETSGHLHTSDHFPLTNEPSDSCPLFSYIWELESFHLQSAGLVLRTVCLDIAGSGL